MPTDKKFISTPRDPSRIEWPDCGFVRFVRSGPLVHMTAADSYDAVLATATVWAPGHGFSVGGVKEYSNGIQVLGPFCQIDATWDNGPEWEPTDSVFLPRREL